MNKKSRIWAAGLALLCIVCLIIWFIIGKTGGGTVAVISVDGREYERIDLSRVRESYDITLSTGYGVNVIHVAPGEISVTEANCPDGICVRQGAISKSGIPIICMPHRLVIQIEGGDLDA